MNEKRGYMKVDRVGHGDERGWNRGKRDGKGVVMKNRTR